MPNNGKLWCWSPWNSPRHTTKNRSWFIFCTPSYYIICWYQYSRFAVLNAGFVCVTTIVAGLYIARLLHASHYIFAAINLAANVLAHPLPNCRLHYYSQVTVDPQKSIDYVQRNRNKKLFIHPL